MASDVVVTTQPGILAPNVQAVLPLSVVAGTKLLNLYGYANYNPPPSVSSDFGVGVYIDGVWFNNFEPNTTSANGLTVFNIALDGNAHDVDIISAYVNYHTPSTNKGNWLCGYENASLRSIAAPTRRLVFYGDSIITGAFAQPVTRYSAFARTRGTYPGRVSGEMYGGRQFLDDTNGSSGGLANITALTTRLIAHANLGGSTTTREIWDAIGYNDWHNATMTAAQFATNKAALYDAIHTADSTIRIYAQSMIVTGAEATLNANLELPAAFRTAMVTAATGRAWVTYVAGTSLMTSGGLNADGVHPSTNGHASIFDGSGGFAGSTNIKTVIGF